MNKQFIVFYEWKTPHGHTNNDTCAWYGSLYDWFKCAEGQPENWKTTNILDVSYMSYDSFKALGDYIDFFTNDEVTE